MTDQQLHALPRYMQADCGHFIPDGSSPNGERYEPIRSRWLPVYLCPNCIPDRNGKFTFKATPQHRKHAK